MTQLNRLFTRLIALSLLAAVLGLGDPAYAAGPVVINEFTGDKKKALRERVVQVIAESGTVVLDDASAQVAANSSADAYVKAATDHDVAAFVDGHTTMRKSGWTLELTVRNGADGSVLDQVALRAGWFPGLLKKVDTDAASSLAGPLDKGKLPLDGGEKEDAKELETADAEEDVGDEPPARKDVVADESPREDSKKRSLRPSALEITGGAGVFTRDFEYNQDVNQNLHGYRLGAAPTLKFSAGWYPAAHFTGDLPAHFGIVGDFEHSVGVSSAPEDGESFGSRMRQFSVGARWRALAGKHEIGVSAKYGQHSFEVIDDEEPNVTVANGTQVERDFVPDVQYGFLRPGLDARFVFGRFQLLAAVGYRSVISTGDMESSVWFPRATAAALDATIGAGVEVIPNLAILISGDVRRYALDMRSAPEDLSAARDVAGGAVDQYFSGQLSVQWRMPSEGGGPNWNIAQAEDDSSSQ